VCINFLFTRSPVDRAAHVGSWVKEGVLGRAKPGTLWVPSPSPAPDSLLHPSANLSRPPGKPLHSPGDRFPIFQEVDGGVVDNSSSLHHLAQIFRLRKLAGLLQVMPLQKNNEFIRVGGAAEKLSSSGTIGLAGEAVGIKRRLPLFIVRHFLSDKEVWHG